MLDLVVNKTRCSLTAPRSAKLVRSASRHRDKTKVKKASGDIKPFPLFGDVEGGIDVVDWALQMQEEDDDYDYEEDVDDDDDDDDYDDEDIMDIFNNVDPIDIPDAGAHENITDIVS